MVGLTFRDLYRIPPCEADLMVAQLDRLLPEPDDE